MAIPDEKYILLHSEEGFSGEKAYGIKILAYISDNSMMSHKESRPALEIDLRKAVYDSGDALKEALFLTSEKKSVEGQMKKSVMLSQFRAAFHEADLGPIYMEEIPNEYSKRYYSYWIPWVLATTRIGIFKLGWRKSVINLDWSRSMITRSGSDIFPDETVTKGGQYGDEDGRQYIHCYGYEKLGKYLKVLGKEDLKKQPCKSCRKLSCDEYCPTKY